MLQCLAAQLPIAPLGAKGPLPWAGPAMLQGATGTLGTVHHLRCPVAAPLAGVWRRWRQGQGLQFLVLEHYIQKRSGELLRGGECDEIVHNWGVWNEGFRGGDFGFRRGAVPEGRGVTSWGHPWWNIQAATESNRGQEGATAQQGPVGALNEATEGTPLRPGGAGWRGTPFLAARVSLR